MQKQTKIFYFRSDHDNFTSIMVIPLRDAKCNPTMQNAWKKENPMIVDRNLKKKIGCITFTQINKPK